MDQSRVAIIGPGRLGTSLAYKFGRDGKDVTIYYHDAEICREINQTHVNPRHLTDDLAKMLGGIEHVPGLTNVTATNDLERVVKENDFIILAITMNRLRELLSHIKPLIARKTGQTCLVSPIKGLSSDEKTSELITPSQAINNHLFDLKHKFNIICIGGPFFEMDIATGKPVCVTVTGNKRAVKAFNLNFLRLNRRELNAYYNFDTVGIEACGALKNIVANLKGATDCLNLGSSLPGTIFARSGVEIRSLTKLLGGSFQAFHSQAGVGDLYVTISSEASKNYRYGKYFYQLFNGNPIETDIRTLEKIDGTPEGPNTIKNVHRYLEKKNMYSPLFRCAHQIFHEETSRDEIREHVIEACQLDKRDKEYIGPISKLLYRMFPNIWYRRHKGILS
ncbi:MAG: NAD(P)-binding domain-containing protein [Deltaproteobacteria bacterium]|nr:NAD(P)-binding domain-containing protein [Deltaproteobacteria bacterium]